MKKFLILAALMTAVFAADANAQTRKSVSAAEVNGTFRSYFKGKFKGSYNEIRILALGKNKLRVSFELIYPFIDGAGEESAHLGTADGTAEIFGDTAVFTSEESDGCRIEIKFVKPGTIQVTQNNTDSTCGFGQNVTADGTYKKSSGAQPKFEPR